ncbi:TetR/AcrR family transcriptional regulator [Rhodococcus sp. NPDC058481]|uniref:TetR/AcrR family transcriptional regulator n=1 Tax=unclassified Rhodococcus (in: high G+C Gram-positive bacteria) TaxID=192944 RepID=UPI0036592A65
MEDEPLRDRLVRCGVELLEREGIAGVSLRAITREADVSHGAPRRYFRTHKALLAAIAGEGLADLTAEVRSILASGDPSARDRLVALGRVYVRFAERRRAMFELMFRHDLLEGSGADLRRTSLPLFDVLVALVDEATAGSVDSRERALAIWTGLHGMAVLAADRALQVISDPRGAAALVDRTVDAHLT